MKKYIILVVILLVIFMSVFIVKNTDTKNIKPIKIGTILSQTGIAAAFGESAKNGAELAAQEINSNSKKDGLHIDIINEDDHTDPKTALGAYKKLTSIDKVDAIIGSNFDFVVNPLFAEAQKSGTVIITPTSPRIAGALDTNINSFTMLSDFSTIVESLRNQLSQMKYKQIAVIHYESSFGKEITKTIDSISKEQTGNTVTDYSYNQFGIKDWTAYILKIKKSGADIVFADMLGTDYANFATQAKGLGLQARLITHMDVREALNSNYDAVLESTIVLNWDTLGDDMAFNDKYRQRYDRKADHFAAQSYAAVYVLAQAIKERRDSNQTLSSVLENNTFETPIGDFDFNINHTIDKTKVKIQQIKSGKLVDIQIIN